METSRYYWMDFVSECQTKIQIDYATWRKHYGRYFYENESILDKVPPPSINLTNRSCISKYDYLISGSIDIFSEELVEFLKDKIHAEFIPIVTSLKGQFYDERKFYLLHCLDRKNALDLVRSVYTKLRLERTGEIAVDDVECVVLDGEKTNNSPAFFLNKPANNIYREDIAKEILARGFNGIRFVPIDSGLHKQSQWPENTAPYL